MIIIVIIFKYVYSIVFTGIEVGTCVIFVIADKFVKTR